MVDESLLGGMDLPKGSRRLISHEERGAVLGVLDGESYKCNAGGARPRRVGPAAPRADQGGPHPHARVTFLPCTPDAAPPPPPGSLSNTLVAVSRLGAASARSDAPLRVGLAGSVGSDPLGDFYRSKMAHAGVAFVSPPVADGTTGTVMVLTTPDAQRTMLSYLGTSGRVSLSQDLLASVAASRLFVVEGYLFELPETVHAICASIAAARAAGSLVALTCADASVVAAHKAGFRSALAAGVDLLFANAREAEELTGEGDAAVAAAALAATVAVAVVTDSSRGAFLASRAAGVLHIPPHWAPTAPVDTCGAGDSFAAGILFGLLHGAPLEMAGSFAARVASAVISRQGARLSEDDAFRLSTDFDALLPLYARSSHSCISV